jgi:hypothetical protein
LDLFFFFDGAGGVVVRGLSEKHHYSIFPERNKESHIKFNLEQPNFGIKLDPRHPEYENLPPQRLLKYC